MKSLLTLAGAVAAIAQALSGATICAPGSLATYIALPTGCTIGTDTLSNFTVLSGIAGAVAIAPGTIQIAPSGGTTSPTLTFTVNVQTSALLEAIFSYRISGSSITASNINLSNTSATGDGGATSIQNLCGGGVFGPDGVSNCTGTTFGPLVVFAPGSDSASFAGVSFLTVSDDVTFDGGLGGTAGGGTFVDRFTASASTAVPEPGTILFAAFGSAVLFTARARSSKRKSTTGRENL